MNHIEKINFLPKIKDAELVLENFLKEHNIKWEDFNNQICLNSIPEKINDLTHGCGSLYRDWNAKYWEDGKVVVPLRENRLQEKDFTLLCDQFRGTLFEDVYNLLNKNFVLGRVRFMRSMPKTCLSWHQDDSIRLHYPIKTQEGCLMVYENKSYFLEKDTWYKTNTLEKHTAVNASNSDRIHLVASILREK